MNVLPGPKSVNGGGELGKDSNFAVQQWWSSVQTYGEYEHQLMEQNKAMAKKERERERETTLSPLPLQPPSFLSIPMAQR